MGANRKDFAHVYEEHVWRVYGFLHYRLQDHARAEDLTQATFERALRAWGRFDRRRSAEQTWLLAIARNLLIDDYRRQGSATMEQLDEQDFPAVEGPEAAVSGRSELTAALAQLPERDREIIALRFGGDLTGPEIASLLGLSLANVQQITSRSLRHLRQLLEAADPPPRTQRQARR